MCRLNVSSDDAQFSSIPDEKQAKQQQLKKSNFEEFITSERVKVVAILALALALCNADCVVTWVAIVGWSRAFSGIVQGSNKCEAIFLDLPNGEEVRWCGKAFKEMKKLRMLIIRNAHFSKGPTYLPNSLRVLEWKCYPSQFLPLDFHPDKLVHLNLPNIGFLDKLRQLSAERCTKLTIFPHCIKLTSLEYLRLSWCSNLRSFPEILVTMKKMTELSLPGTAIEELPSSIGNAVGLEILNLAECEHLKQLPTTILMLPKLWILSTKLCREFSGFKEYCKGGDEKEQVSLVSSNIRFLSLSNCNLSDESLAVCLSSCPNLMFLDLSFNNFTTLPSCIKECHFLRDLLLDNCKQLQHIAGMAPNLETFKAKNCTLLTSLSSSILLNQAFQLPGNRNFIFPGNRIPQWFNHCNDGQSVSFWVRKEFPAIVVCFVVGVLGDRECTLNFKLSVRINGTDQKFCSDQGLMSTLAIDHIFLCDLQSRLPMDELDKVLLPDEWNHVEVLCMNDSLIRLKGGVIKWSAIHVYNKENGMEMENIRFTKPNSPKRTFHDIWNKDLEPSNYYPLSKKQRTSLENTQQKQQCLAFHSVDTISSTPSCSTSMKSTSTTQSTISDEDREPVDHQEKFQATLPTLASTDNVTGKDLHAVDEIEMEAFYNSLDADLSVVSPFANPRLNEETRKALETLHDFMSKDFSDFLYPRHYSNIRTTLEYLSNLSADGGVSVKTRSLVLEVSREFARWSRDFYEAGTKIESSKAKLLKADEIEEGLGVNMNQFRKFMALEKEHVEALASLEETKKKLEEQMNDLKVEICNSRLSKDATAKRKREIYEEGKMLKVERDELREQEPYFTEEWESANETQLNIKAEWSKLGEKFKSVKGAEDAKVAVMCWWSAEVANRYSVIGGVHSVLEQRTVVSRLVTRRHSSRLVCEPYRRRSPLSLVVRRRPPFCCVFYGSDSCDPCLSGATDLDHQIVPAYVIDGRKIGLLIWSYDLYGIPDVQPHAYMAGVMIGHDACGIVAKNKKVFAIDFLFVADAFLVVVCKVMCTMIYSHGSLVHGSMEGEHCETQDVLGSQPGKVAFEVPSSSTPAWSAGRLGARVGRTGACSRCPSLQSTPCWTLAGGRSWGTQDPLTAIYIRTRRKRPGGRTVCS
ncbi:TMV resistance protein N-like isoform X1 [Senna tora]|uniref:TMV resistance protein N-like isoform X1 n=1 Tax=Senna tora TaxID=362788 RepID=A0A834TNA4_9FABA|nr:TMV resistance protein N-like isoform X1 [Senna tora]